MSYRDHTLINYQLINKLSYFLIIKKNNWYPVGTRYKCLSIVKRFLLHLIFYLWITTKKSKSIKLLILIKFENWNQHLLWNLFCLEMYSLITVYLIIILKLFISEMYIWAFLSANINTNENTFRIQILSKYTTLVYLIKYLHIEDANYAEFEFFSIYLFPIFNYINSINLKTKNYILKWSILCFICLSKATWSCCQLFLSIFSVYL